MRPVLRRAARDHNFLAGAAPHSPVGDTGLDRFGYIQELFRNMGGFSNFAISFSIISVLTGAVTLFGYGFEMGGPLEMSLGWPLATVFTLVIAASMAELCSAYPTSGAMYHWAADLGGPAIGWGVAMLNIIGLVAAQSGIDYSCAQFVLPFLGISATRPHLFLMFAFILANQGVLNHFGIRLVAILNDLSVSVHILGVMAIVAAVYWMAPLQPVSYLREGFTGMNHVPYWWAFVLGLLQAQWTFTGFDASAHMAEETLNPRVRAPWGIVLSVAVAGVTGYLLILALTLAIHDHQAILHRQDSSGSETPAAIAILQLSLGPRFGNMMAALASMAMWFCGLSCITSASRALFSLARDHGTLAAEALRRVSKRHGTPGPAIWTIVAASLAAMLWTAAVPVVTSLSTVALYSAYAIPIALGLRDRLAGSDWPKFSEWSLGRFGSLLNGIAVGYSAFIVVVLMLPPNQLAGWTMLATIGVLGTFYFLVIRRSYRGPAWRRR
ncbi:MAG TPA: amino acid permease [Bryobacteraceae bacterium]|nr:amino acid permease [Bryobacteraceae bacterium]